MIFLTITGRNSAQSAVKASPRCLEHVINYSLSLSPP